MDPAVAAQHIQLYVNEYTVALDERAVHALLDWQQRQGPGPAVTSSLPVFA
jgi:predicted solute-binding protein